MLLTRSSGSSLSQQVYSILQKYGTDAHVYLPGIGTINGLTAGNYLESTGITAATVDNPVGLVLDAAGSVGAELTVNGDFSNGLTGWTLNANATGIASVVGGALTYAAPHGDYAEVKQLSVCTIGKAYKVEFDVVTAGTTVNTITVQCGRATVITGTASGTFTVGRKSAIVYATHSDGFSISCRTDATIAIDNISVKEVTGIHAIQATTANKPLLRYVSGRYYFDFVDDTDVLNATYPAGWESVTTIDAAPTGQATLTAQNIVGTYAITTDTYGRFVFKTITASELATIQTFANRLAGVQPSQVSDLFSSGEQGAWYDPSDFSTMFQDAAGSIPVTAVGQAVGRILDKSGRGNHATQTTDTKRPVLSALVNFVLSTEDPTTSAWTKGRVSVNKNIDDPDGGNTAFSVYETSETGGHFCSQIITTPPSSSTKRVVFLKYAGVRFVVITANQDLSDRGICIDLESGSISSIGASVTSSSISVYKAGWYRVEFITNAGAQFSLQIALRSTTGTTNQSYTGDPSKGVIIWRPDTRSANFGANLPSYQRVNTATDYDTTGFPPYLLFDGIDDALQTASINFTGTDKVTIWAGVRKLSDAARGIIVELGNTQLNSFRLNTSTLGSTPAVGAYRFDTSGNIEAFSSTNTIYPAPITNTLTGIGDILNNICTIKVNNVNADFLKTGSTGIGNYGNYPLYIGSRGGTTLPFNGRLYSMIVRGAQSTAAQITNTENYVNSRTGAY